MPPGVKAATPRQVYEHNVTNRRTFLAWVGSLPLLQTRQAAPPVVVEAAPTALFQQPDVSLNLSVDLLGVYVPPMGDCHGILRGHRI